MPPLLGPGMMLPPMRGVDMNLPSPFILPGLSPIFRRHPLFSGPRRRGGFPPFAMGMFNPPPGLQLYYVMGDMHIPNRT